jgi:hypothetical protein
MTEKQLRQKYINGLLDLEGKCAEGSANHSALLAVYNTLDPLPRGVKMLPSYDWCAATITANAIRQDMTGIFAKECSCTMQIRQWQQMGRWVERDDYVPQTGDIIYYAWDATGAGDWAKSVDHVGAVLSCEGGYITAIEGNYKNNISRRRIPVNYKFIRGFAVPDYASLATQEDDDMVRYKTIDEIPEGYRAETRELMALGFNGYGDSRGLGVTDDMLRCMIVNLRMCKALIAAVPGIDKAALFAEFKRNLKLSIEVA